MLPTARIVIGDRGKYRIKVKALLDPCSETTLIKESLLRTISGRIEPIKLNVVGVDGRLMDSARVRAQIYVYSGKESTPISVEVHGLKHIGITTPSVALDHKVNQFDKGFRLADPEFTKPAAVDIVLGANVYSRLLLSGIQINGSLLCQETIFGWIVTGVTKDDERQTFTSLTTTVTSTQEDLCHEKIIDLLQRFWATEEIPRRQRVSKDDTECEKQFNERHTKDSTGRYIVPLPLKGSAHTLLGTSLPSARLALSAQHQRMQRDEKLKEAYVRFMDEYLQTGHMRQLTQEELKDKSLTVNYIPHHGIWQRGDTGPKLRVVFNASWPTSSGSSLNDVLYAGLKLQNNLATVITRWRRHKFVYCADIKMMFRQILIKPVDTHLQRIIWSQTPPEDRLRPSWLHLTTGGLVSELGLASDPLYDQFRFSPPKFNQTGDLTKRKVVSELAKVFDPIGWLAPMILIGKIFVQDLWRAKLD